VIQSCYFILRAIQSGINVPHQPQQRVTRPGVGVSDGRGWQQAACRTDRAAQFSDDGGRGHGCGGSRWHLHAARRFDNHIRVVSECRRNASDLGGEWRVGRWYIQRRQGRYRVTMVATAAALK